MYKRSLPIYHLSPASAVGGGAALPFVEELVAAQRAQGIDARLIVCAPWAGRIADYLRGRPPRPDAWATGRRIARAPAEAGAGAQLAWLAPYLPLPGRSPQQKLGAVLRLLRGAPPGVVHGHLLHEEGWVAARAVRALRGAGQPAWRSLVSAHGSDVHTVLSPSPCGTPEPRAGGAGAAGARTRADECLRQADRVLAVAHDLAERLAARGSPVAGVLAVGGVDHERFKPGPGPLPGERRLVFIGRLSAAKGVPTLLAAFAELRRDWQGEPAPVLELIGPAGDALSQVEQLVDASATRAAYAPEATAATLRLVGPLSRAGVARRLPGAAALVLPSRAEGLPVVALEALACGVPLVASAVGDLPRLLGAGGGDCGVLVPPADPLALRAALAAVLTRSFDPPALRQRSRPFELRALAAAWAAQYRALAEPGAHRPASRPARA